MTRKDDSLHLNGSSQDFLASYYGFREKMLNHLERSEKSDGKLDKVEKDVADLKTEQAVQKQKMETIDTEVKVVIGILVSMFLLMVGAFFYVVTNGVPTGQP